MAERLNLALAQCLGPLSNQAEDENIGHVLFHNRAAAKTPDSCHVFEISWPYSLSWCLAQLRKTVCGLDCGAIVLFVTAL